ncbi:stress-responsive transcription factor hsf1 [Bulinus truncatus]|nr:stress-responsive transcription factor hsf1 [Bulinus truncatus]
MYSAVENTAGNVPAFLIKLWTLVEDPSTDELIHWDASGTSFHVFDQQRFSREILPLYFKHNNIASFIRQLNMYGFRKVTHIDQGGLKIEKDDLQFQHLFFQRGERDMLQFIKRKVSNQAVRTADPLTPTKTDEVTRVLADMKQVKVKQDSMDQNLEYIKRENKLLWREVAMLRQKHHKQQQIVNKLIQFLVSLVSSNRTGLTIPIRRAPLAINDVSQLAAQQGTNNSHQDAVIKNEMSSQIHMSQVSPSNPVEMTESFEDEQYTIESPKVGDFIIPSASNNSGPIIHELTDNVQTYIVPDEDITVVDPGENQDSEDLLQSFLKSDDPVTSSVSQPVRNISVLPQALPNQTVTIAPFNPSYSNFLMSPKIEAAPTLEDALNFGLNVPSSSGTVISNTGSPMSSTLSQSSAGSQKRKRKTITLPATNSKKVNVQTNENAVKKPMSQSQATTLKNLVMANSDLNSNAQQEQEVSESANSVASLAVASSKDNDDFTISSDQLDLLSSDLDGLKGILQDQYRVDPSFLMELFESSNPWPLNQDKDFEELKAENERDEASTSDNGNITGTELVEYNPRDDLFPELLDDNIMGDIDDID